MSTSNKHNDQKNIQNPENTPVYYNRPDERRDDLEQDEEELDENEVDAREDWGDVDPAGGPAPSSPGSAV